MEYNQDVNSCPYAFEPEPLPMLSPSCTDSFSNNVAPIAAQPIKTERFKPTRPTYDFSNDGLLTSLDDFQPTQITSSPIPVIDSQESYTVKPGDSLWIIAKRYHVSTNEIANANGISRDATLRVGQKLIIPNSTNATITTPQAEGAIYTIARGDTLSEIAMRFKVSVDAIKKANNMMNNNIVAGKKIVIPGVTSEQIASTSPFVKSSPSFSVGQEGAYYVQNGDSLSVIAHRFGVSVSNLMAWNNISDARKLRAGQALIVRDPNSPISVEAVPYTTNNWSSTNAEVSYSLPEPVAPSTEEDSMPFDYFADDDLFGTSNEIPLFSFDEE